VPSSPAEQIGSAQDQAARLREILVLTARAEHLLQSGQIDEAVRTARRANSMGVSLGPTWRVFGQALEAQGDLPTAASAYEQAAAAGADVAALSIDRARVAMRQGAYAQAEQHLKLHHTLAGPTTQTIGELARAQTALMAFDRAYDTLQTALQANPVQPLLWLALGQLLCVQGQHGQAIMFFEEALRLDPSLARARDGLADAVMLGAGDVDRALAESHDALAAAAAEDVPALNEAHARRLLAAGRLAEGWDAFARAAEPCNAALVDIRAAAPRWTPGAPLKGRLLLIGEGDVVDDILLMQVVPSIIAGGAKVILAIDGSLTTLAQRSLPDAMVVPLLHRTQGGKTLRAASLDSPHVHGGALVAAWAPLRSLIAAHRGRREDFVETTPYLKPESARVRFWRGRLASLGPGPKVGMVWRAHADARFWQAPPLSGLQAPLAVPGIHPISLQSLELAELTTLQDAFGLTIYPRPPELRYTDADDLAALMRALDVVIGPPDTETFLAAASGAETWFLSTPRHWAMLGTRTFPWFPRARAFTAAAPDDWTEAMAELGQALEDFVRSPPETRGPADGGRRSGKRSRPSGGRDPQGRT
jgi:tetratricopeptide (TPR) repeat protein